MLYGVCIDFYRWQNHSKYYRRQLHRGVNREFRRSWFIFAVHADVRARGQNNKPPSIPVCSWIDRRNAHAGGDLLFMYKKKYNHTARCYYSHTALLYSVVHFRTLRAINALTGGVRCKPPQRFAGSYFFFLLQIMLRVVRAQTNNKILFLD